MVIIAETFESAKEAISTPASLTIVPRDSHAVYVASQHTMYIVYRGDDANPFTTAFDHGTGRYTLSVRIGTNPAA